MKFRGRKKFRGRNSVYRLNFQKEKKKETNGYQSKP